MPPEEISREILRFGRELGARDIAALISEETWRMVRFSNNSVTVSQSWTSTTPLVYLAAEKKRAASRISEIDTKSIQAAMTEMMRSMKVAAPSDVDSQPPKGPFNYSTIDGIYDSRIRDLSGELVDMAESAIRGALSEGASRASGTVEAVEWKTMVETSNEARGEESGTLLQIAVRAFVDDEASGQGISCATMLDDFEPERAGREAGEIAKMARDPKPGRAGTYAIIFSPSVMGNLLNTTGFAASAYAVDAGFSYLANRLGQKVASDAFTLVDDRKLPRGPGARKFDDEGNPTETTPIIEDGVLKNYLHDSYTAAKTKSRLTGNAGWNSNSATIIPVPMNLVVRPGAYPVDELLDELGDGLYITNNWYTRFQNYRSGDFSTICRDAAFRVVDGEITSAVKNLRISDNMPDMLRNIRGLSKETRWIKWWEVDVPINLPHFLIEDVGVTTSTK